MNAKLKSILIILVLVHVPVYADEMQSYQNMIDTGVFVNGRDGENEELNLQDLKLQQDRLSQVLRNVHETKLLSDVDIEELDKQGEALAKAAFNAFLIANAKTRAAAESEGERGDANAIADVEIVMTSLETEMREVYRSAINISSDVRVGNIVLSSSLIDRMSNQELRDTLDDRMLQVYKERNLIDPSRVERVKRLKRGSPLSSLDEFKQPTLLERSTSMALLDFVIPRAHAALAAPCAIPCGNKDWINCSLCVAAASPDAIEAWNDFQSCWNRSRGFFKWIRRTLCLAEFLFKLA